MRRFVALLLLAVLLAGCGTPDPTEPAQTLPSTEQTQPATEPATLPQFQEGSVATFVSDFGNCTGIFSWGDEHWALLTADGQLIRLAGEALAVENSLELGCVLYAGDPTIVVTDTQLSYYDALRNVYVTLGKNLTEVSSVSLPDDLAVGPLMSADLSTIYYGTESTIRAMDISDGTSRLVRQEHEAIVALNGIFFDGSILSYTRHIADGQTETCFIRTTDGSLVSSSNLSTRMITWGDSYAAEVGLSGPVEQYRELLTGTLGSGEKSVAAGSDWSDALFPGDGTLLLQTLTDEGLVLELYDLNQGCILAGTTFDRQETFFWAAKAGESLWLTGNEQEEFYRWDYSGDAPQAQSALTDRYTLTDPNQAAMEQVAQQLLTLSENYGITIRIADDRNRTAGVDYSVYPDYRPQQYLAALELLNEALARFPQDFFSKMQQGLVIELVDDFDPATGDYMYSGTVSTGDETEIKVSISNNLPPILYHELYHAMELVIYTQTSALTQWDQLNPQDFAYTGEYIRAEDSPYLTEGENAFADDYAMVRPGEDRAQIFMYAMMEGEAARFQSDIMQAKLTSLCGTIRTVFGWENVPEALPWEQYLKS